MADPGFPCYECVFKKDAAGSALIGCIAPWNGDEILDVMRRADSHGVKHGWFAFPFVFDPIWARPGGEAVECARFVPKRAVA